MDAAGLGPAFGSGMLGLLAGRIRLPFTVVLAVVGFLAGWIGGPLGFEMPLEGEQFEEVLVFVFLPVLVFAAALGLSTRAFLNNLGPILVLAVLALVVSAALVGASLYFVLGIPLAALLWAGPGRPGPSRASLAVRKLWKQLWDSLDYIANAVLFLLIGLSIDLELIAENLGAIGLAIGAWNVPASTRRRPDHTPHRPDLLHEVGDQIEESDLARITMDEMESTRGQRSFADRLLHRLSELLPQPTPANQAEQAYDEVGARRLGARRAREDLDEFHELPNTNASALRAAQDTFRRWEDEALDSLSELDFGTNDGSSKLRHRRAEALSSLPATHVLQELVAKGLLPEELAARAAGEIKTKVKED